MKENYLLILKHQPEGQGPDGILSRDRGAGGHLSLYLLKMLHAPGPPRAELLIHTSASQGFAAATQRPPLGLLALVASGTCTHGSHRTVTHGERVPHQATIPREQQEALGTEAESSCERRPFIYHHSHSGSALLIKHTGLRTTAIPFQRPRRAIFPSPPHLTPKCQYLSGWSSYTGLCCRIFHCMNIYPLHC